MPKLIWEDQFNSEYVFHQCAIGIKGIYHLIGNPLIPSYYVELEIDEHNSWVVVNPTGANPAAIKNLVDSLDQEFVQ